MEAEAKRKALGTGDETTASIAARQEKASLAVDKKGTDHKLRLVVTLLL